MNEMLILSGVVGLLWLAAVYLRIPPAMLLLSILVGKLFAEELSPDIYGFLTGLLNGVSPLYIQLGLMLLPVILTVVFLKGTAAKSKLIINAIPLLFCVVSLALFISPYVQLVDKLKPEQRVILNENQGNIVSLAAGTTLLSVWLPNIRKSHEKSSKKKHKHK